MTFTPSQEGGSIRTFENRKADHIRIALSEGSQAMGSAGFERIQLIHESLPERDFSSVSLKSRTLARDVQVPLMISGMTAGHEGGLSINRRLAKCAAKRGWWMGVGSQRRQLTDSAAVREWLELRQAVPDVQLLGNLGLTQAIQCTSNQVERLAESIGAVAMVIHTNPLQECLQVEGTPQFSGGVEALSRLARDLKVPIVLKETGCGMAAATMRRLKTVGLAAVDVSGFGGTHWGRVEGARAPEGDVRASAAEAFADWGLSTVESLVGAQEAEWQAEVWASGGVRSGVDAAKALALGATMVGFARPALAAALEGETALNDWMEAREYELRTAMFCAGVGTVSEFRERRVWQWRKI